MHLPRPPLPTDRDIALFLDVDGTLAEFHEDPGSVRLSDSLLVTLTALQTELQGAIALVSGRRVAELDRLVRGRTLCCVGLHGLAANEHCPAELRDAPVATDLRHLEAACRDFLKDYPEVRLEHKGHGIALHYRRCPGAGDDVQAFARRYLQDRPQDRPQDRACKHGLQLLPGKMVVEFKPEAANKGTALQRLLSHPPFRSRSPVFVGDDVTDEAGFQWVNRAGGISIKCGDGETQARYRLPDVDSVNDWLQHYLTHLTRA